MALKDWRTGLEPVFRQPVLGREVAAWMGISYEAYRKIESGHTSLKKVHINALCWGMETYTNLSRLDIIKLALKLDY